MEILDTSRFYRTFEQYGALIRLDSEPFEPHTHFYMFWIYVSYSFSRLCRYFITTFSATCCDTLLDMHISSDKVKIEKDLNKYSDKTFNAPVAYPCPLYCGATAYPMFHAKSLIDWILTSSAVMKPTFCPILLYMT